MSTIINKICKSFSQSGLKVCILTHSRIAKKEKSYFHIAAYENRMGYERHDIFGLT